MKIVIWKYGVNAGLNTLTQSDKRRSDKGNGVTATDRGSNGQVDILKEVQKKYNETENMLKGIGTKRERNLEQPEELKRR